MKLHHIAAATLLAAMLSGLLPSTPALDNMDYQPGTFYRFTASTPTSLFSARFQAASPAAQTLSNVSATGANVHGGTSYTAVVGAGALAGTSETAVVSFVAAGSGSFSNLFTVKPAAWNGAMTGSPSPFTGVSPLVGNVQQLFTFGTSNAYDTPSSNSSAVELTFTFTPPSDGDLRLTCFGCVTASVYVPNVNLYDAGFNLLYLPLSLRYARATEQCFASCATGQYALVAIPTADLADATPNTPTPVIPRATCQVAQSNITVPGRVVSYVNTSLSPPELYGDYFKVTQLGALLPITSVFSITNGTSNATAGNYTSTYPANRNSSASAPNDTAGYVLAISDHNDTIVATCAFVISTNAYAPALPVVDAPALTAVQQTMQKDVLSFQFGTTTLNDSQLTHQGVADSMAWAYRQSPYMPRSNGPFTTNQAVLLYIIAAMACVSAGLVGFKGRGGTR